MAYQKKDFKKKQTWRKRNNSKQPNHYAEFVYQRNNEYWENTIPILKEMFEELKALGKPPEHSEVEDNIYYCVKLSNLVSKYQDLIHKIEWERKGRDFNKYMLLAGRHEETERRDTKDYGPVPFWNTTEKGEQVTADTLYFGPDIGLPRMSATEYLNLPRKNKVALYHYQNGKYQSNKKAKWMTKAIVDAVVIKFNKDVYYGLIKELNDWLVA